MTYPIICTKSNKMITFTICHIYQLINLINGSYVSIDHTYQLTKKDLESSQNCQEINLKLRQTPLKICEKSIETFRSAKGHPQIAKNLAMGCPRAVYGVMGTLGQTRTNPVPSPGGGLANMTFLDQLISMIS